MHTPAHLAKPALQVIPHARAMQVAAPGGKLARSRGIELVQVHEQEPPVGLVGDILGVRVDGPDGESHRVLGTVYADGLPRRLGEVGGEVLVGGRRKPIAGTVTMDQLLVDLGPTDVADPVEIGTEVVLLGRQGEETITASEWAGRLGTIAYEVCCGIGDRVPRRYVG